MINIGQIRFSEFSLQVLILCLVLIHELFWISVLDNYNTDRSGKVIVLV